MTRENKLGLLVGLAFIIVVGILISDHLSSTNEPASAPLKVAGDTLRSGLGEPGNDDVAPVLRAPSSVTPSQQLVTNAELNRRNAQPPVRFVQPGNARSGDAITPVTPINNPNQQLTIAERLRQAAEQQGEQLVAVNDPNGSHPFNGGNTPANPPRLDPPAKPTVSSYVAQPGDSLALIARKVYGSSSKANRQAIINANSDLVDDPNLIMAGQTYVIPPLAAAVPANNPVTPAPAPTPDKPANEKTIVYVVQAHDTLWSIAVNEVGNAGAVAAIRELNQTVLNGTDRVKPNMKLKLPAKQS